MNGITVLSLGAGVQSTTLALLAIDGLIPAPDVAIFADTGWEPVAVYDHLDLLTPALSAAGIEVARVSAGNIRERAASGFHPIPAFTASGGIGARQCTNQFKLAPIKAEIRRRLGARVDPDTGRVGRVKRDRQAVVQVGISYDEIGRARDSTVGYIRNVHPLLDMPTPWTRAACQAYLEERWTHGVVPRSACIGCPFHSDAEWAALTQTEFEDACEFDDALGSEVFLHSRRIPLREVELAPKPPPSQISMFDAPSCSPWGCTRFEVPT